MVSAMRASLLLALAMATVAAPAPVAAQAGAGQGTLVVSCDVVGAEVIVDEEPRGETPLPGPVALEPGSYTLRVRRPGYTEHTDVVRIEAGRELVVDVALEPLAMVLSLRTNPDEARVYVDEAFRGETPLELELPAGEHQLRLSHPLMHDALRTIPAVAGRTLELDFDLDPLPPSALVAPTPWYEQPGLWLGIGGAAVAVAIAIVVVAFLTSEGQSQLERFCGVVGTGCVQQVMPDWTS